MSVAKLAITFDRDSTVVEQLDLLKDLLKKGLSLTLIDVKYTQEIGKIINKGINNSQIRDFNFNNLEKGKKIIANNEILEIKSILHSMNPRLVRCEDKKFFKIGEFELLEESKLLKNTKNF